MLNKMASFAIVLGNPTRIALSQHIVKINSCICGDLVQETGLAPAAISQHLNELKNIGLIKGNMKGISVCYGLDPSGWTKLCPSLLLF